MLSYMIAHTACAAICYNCATLDSSTCRCSCADGFYGVDCSGKCFNITFYEAFNWPVNNAIQISKSAPLDADASHHTHKWWSLFLQFKILFT